MKKQLQKFICWLIGHTTDNEILFVLLGKKNKALTLKTTHCFRCGKNVARKFTPTFQGPSNVKASYFVTIKK